MPLVLQFHSGTSHLVAEEGCHGQFKENTRDMHRVGFDDEDQMPDPVS